jgi:hypothetical protein
VDPAAITEEGLKEMNPQCMRAVTDQDYVKIMLQAIKGGMGAGEAWVEAYQQVYLDPLKIPAGVSPSWSADSVAAIVAENPTLSSASFVLPASSSRPYPIVSTTMIGPEEGAPYDMDKNRNLSMFEMTPLYVGTMNSSE